MTLVSARQSASTPGRRHAISFAQIVRMIVVRLAETVARIAPRHSPARPDVRGAHAWAFGRLSTNLSPILHYHALRHTHDDVLPAVERIAALSGVAGHDLALLRTAAVFHDIGYTQTQVEHEAASIAIARDVLPRFGFSADDIERIAGMIAATKLPQTPQTPLEAILADADLDSLGRNDFFVRSEELHSECVACGRPTDQQTWYEQQRRFLQGHAYHTAAARLLRDAQKHRNIARLTRYLSV